MNPDQVAKARAVFDAMPARERRRLAKRMHARARRQRTCPGFKGIITSRGQTVLAHGVLQAHERGVVFPTYRHPQARRVDREARAR